MGRFWVPYRSPKYCTFDLRPSKYLPDHSSLWSPERWPEQSRPRKAKQGMMWGLRSEVLEKQRASFIRRWPAMWLKWHGLPATGDIADVAVAIFSADSRVRQ